MTDSNEDEAIRAAERLKSRAKSVHGRWLSRQGTEEGDDLRATEMALRQAADELLDFADRRILQKLDREGRRMTRPMDLSNLSIGDLECLGSIIRAVPYGLEVMADSEGWSSDTLDSVRITIRKDLSFTILIEIGSVFSGPPEDVFELVEPPVAEPQTGGGAAMPAKPAAPKKKTGPLTDGERAEIHRLAAEGYTASGIAERIGRAAGVIAMMIKNARRAQEPEIPAGQPVQIGTTQLDPASDAGPESGEPEGHERPVPSNSIAPDAAAEAGAAAAEITEMPQPPLVAAPMEGMSTGEATLAPVDPNTEMLGGDRRGLQRHSPVEHDPVQAEGPTPPPKVRPEAGIPDGLKGEQRRIWIYLDRVGYGGGFDAELDFELIEALAGGASLAHVALDLDMDLQALAERSRMLNACVRGDRGRVTIEGQRDLIAMLKARVIRMRSGGRPS